jgi:hypothetical protein
MRGGVRTRYFRIGDDTGGTRKRRLHRSSMTVTCHIETWAGLIFARDKRARRLRLREAQCMNYSESSLTSESPRSPCKSVAEYVGDA